MVGREGKRISADSYKDVLLSAGSEKGGRKENLGVSVDKRTLLFQREIDGRSGTKQVWRPKVSVRVQYGNQGQRGMGLLSAEGYKSDTNKELGQDKRSQVNKELS